MRSSPVTKRNATSLAVICARAGALEYHSLERGQAGSVEVFDHFNDGGRVEAGQALVAVHERAVHQLDPLALLRGQAIKVQAALRDLQRAVRDIHPDDSRE